MFFVLHIIMNLTIPFPQTVSVHKKEDNRAIIQIDGCYPGYGITLGNALRRVLLSSLPGTAATAVKIAGIQHEFSTIPNVKEDVVMITLNLKKIHFLMHDVGPTTASLKVKGEKKVTAKDIKLPSSVEITNPDTHIATITDKKGVFELELTIEKGLGYVSAEQMQKEKLPIGTIMLDAIYTPVLHVNTTIENMRIGGRTDYNRILLDIITDGSTSPEEAFKQAVKILFNQFSYLLDTLPGKKKGAASAKLNKGVKKKASKKDRVKTKKTDSKKNSLEDLKLKARTVAALEKGGIKSIAGLARKKAENLASLDGLGEKSVSEIKKALKKVGLNLKE